MANSIERIGIHYCGKIAAENKWMFREQPTDDIGIDAYMEFSENGKSNQIIGLQIKSGESYFNEKKDNSIVFRKINKRQYEYWTMNSLPCIIILYNPTSNLCIWQKLTSDTIKVTKQGKGIGYYVNIPVNQVFLNNVSHKQLLSLTNLPQSIQNYNFLLSQKRFMEIIQKGGEVKIHSKEWVNKLSGRGKIKLIVDDGTEIKEYLYPYYFPGRSYSSLFPELFPWADFSVDEDFFEENDLELWRQEYGFYDSETGDWFIVGDSFEEFRKELDPLRSIDHGGEIAEYMLLLSLNDLGRSFLNVEQFLSQNLLYVELRPELK